MYNFIYCRQTFFCFVHTVYEKLSKGHFEDLFRGHQNRGQKTEDRSRESGLDARARRKMQEKCFSVFLLEMLLYLVSGFMPSA